MFDRRYAALGWFVWQFAKRYLRKRGKNLVPGAGGGGGAPIPVVLAAVGGVLAAIGGALWFFRRGDGDGDGDDWPEPVERP